ncbi:MAG: putative exosortase interaction domain protein [Massilia sp.]|nr:putative exosortase interaction domain protein [Massilia sp.]
MKKKLLSLKSLALAALLSTAAVAHADITVFTTQAAFLAAVSAPGTDTYDDLLVGGTYPSPLPRLAGTYSYTAATSSINGFFPVGSGTDHWLSTVVPTDSIIFSTFAPGVVALGGFFFGTDVGGTPLPATTITLTAQSGETQTVELNGANVGTFLGFLSTSQLTSVVMNVTQPANDFAWATVNDLTLAVPEPASYGMLLAGLGLVGFMARRRAA